MRKGYWTSVIGRVLSGLLARSCYSEERKVRYDRFFQASIVPFLGPCPDEYTSSSPPVSFMCDDHTPLEIGWVFKSTGEMSVQYAIDALAPSDGTPLSPGANLELLSNLATNGSCQNFDISWSRKCTMSLLCPPNAQVPQHLQRVSQFFIGDYPLLFSTCNPRLRLYI